MNLWRWAQFWGLVARERWRQWRRGERRYHPAHAAVPAVVVEAARTLAESEEHRVRYGSMILAEERELHHEPTEYSGGFDGAGDGWSAADLAALHDAPTVFDDRGPGVREFASEADLVRHLEDQGWFDPRVQERLRHPAPTRLLRTTGELLNAELLAECTAFMARQDAEVAVWLAGAGERWAAA